VEELENHLNGDEINNILAGFKEEWEADPSAITIDMSKLIDTEPGEHRSPENRSR